MNPLKNKHLGLESTGSHKEMKTEANLKKNRFGRSSKMRQMWSGVKSFTCTGVRCRCFTNVLFVTEQKGILLLLSYCQKCNQLLEGTIKEYAL